MVSLYHASQSLSRAFRYFHEVFPLQSTFFHVFAIIRYPPEKAHFPLASSSAFAVIPANLRPIFLKINSFFTFFHQPPSTHLPPSGFLTRREPAPREKIPPESAFTAMPPSPFLPLKFLVSIPPTRPVQPTVPAFLRSGDVLPKPFTPAAHAFRRVSPPNEKISSKSQKQAIFFFF